MRVGIYEDLLAINEATEQFTKRLERLRNAKVLTPHYAELRVLAARQNCAEVTGSIVNKLAKPEMDAAYRLEQEFAAKTTRLAALKDKKNKRAIKARKKKGITRRRR